MNIDLDHEYQRRQHPSGGEVRAMAAVNGYVMARKPGCVPFVVPLSEWCDWLPYNPNGHSIPEIKTVEPTITAIVSSPYIFPRTT